MKTTAAILSALVGLLSSARADSVILSDNFSGASLNTSIWTAILPTVDSVVEQSGGAVNLANRGTLATAFGISGAYIISGAFTMNDDFEHFNVGFRTDLSTVGDPFYERQGLVVSFANDGPGGGEISIQRYVSPVDWEFLAKKTNFDLVIGQTYFFSIFDDGLNVSLSVNGMQELATASTFSKGNRVAFLARDFGEGSSLDAVTITHVPDSGRVVSLFAASFVLLAHMRRRFSQV